MVEKNKDINTQGGYQKQVFADLFMRLGNQLRWFETLPMKDPFRGVDVTKYKNVAKVQFLAIIIDHLDSLPEKIQQDYIHLLKTCEGEQLNRLFVELARQIYSSKNETQYTILKQNQCTKLLQKENIQESELPVFPDYYLPQRYGLHDAQNLIHNKIAEKLEASRRRIALGETLNQ